MTAPSEPADAVHPPLDLDPAGLAVRREVLGADHIDAALVRADDITAC